MKLSKILGRSEVASVGFTSVDLAQLKYCNVTIQKKKTLINYIELQLGVFLLPLLENRPVIVSYNQTLIYTNFKQCYA